VKEKLMLQYELAVKQLNNKCSDGSLKGFDRLKDYSELFKELRELHDETLRMMALKQKHSIRLLFGLFLYIPIIIMISAFIFLTLDQQIIVMIALFPSVLLSACLFHKCHLSKFKKIQDEVAGFIGSPIDQNWLISIERPGVLTPAQKDDLQEYKEGDSISIAKASEFCDSILKTWH
jgi:hypothetical protein